MRVRLHGAARSVYRTLLMVLPGEFRSRYGNEMVSVFDQVTIAARRRRGWPGVLVTWLRMFGELGIVGIRERFGRQEREPELPRKVWVKDMLRNDVRYAIRALRKSPGFAAVVIATLAIGVGANTAIFSVVNGVILRALPYEEPDRLAALWLEFRRSGSQHGGEIVASEPEYLDFSSESSSFQSIAGYWTGEANLGGLAEPERISMAAVSANFLQVLGVSPALGRGFVIGEDLREADDVVVLGDALWRRSFGSATDVVGRTVLMNGRPATVIGVLPGSFRFPGGDVEILRINKIDPINPAGRSSHYLSMIGRLRAGISMEAARAETATLMSRWDSAFPDRHGPSVTHPIVFNSLRERMVGHLRPALLILLGAVGLVLLIACANVANLMIARAEGRQREIGIRAALGASRGRLVAQVLVDSLVIAIVSGAVGLALAAIGVKILAQLGPVDLPRIHDIQIDGVVLAFAASASLATGLLFGIAPAFAAAQSDLSAMFKGTNQFTTAGTRRLFFRNALVVGEIGLAVVLVVGAALLIKSFARLTDVDPGFRTAGVITLDFSLNTATYPNDEDVARFHTELVERVEALPGIVAAGAVRALPLHATPGIETLTIYGGVEGTVDELDTGDRSTFNAMYQIASPGYFQALSIPLLEGRIFDRGDVAGSVPVAIINETMADRLWPNGGAIGKRLRLGAFANNPNPEMTIVGVLGDVLQTSLDAQYAPQLFVPRQQAAANYGGLATRFATFVARAETDPVTTIRAVRNELRALDPGLPVADMQSMERVVAQSVSDRRFTSLLMGIFSAIALVLGAVGIYGLMSYNVARRTREIGLRMALGANRGNVIGSVVLQAGILTLVGASVGIVVAFLTSRVVAGLLFNVSVRDPVVFVGAPILLALVALLAAYVPARRAAMVDPVEAFRAE